MALGIQGYRFAKHVLCVAQRSALQQWKSRKQCTAPANITGSLSAQYSYMHK
ncbi:hypothetical protein SCLCIDRAFT_1211259 [Scleroderma citrinum Foug A]|uniref:Uncharacterized protein n=1 Tax=Scleroderma citrinum Foug A TaxID=1036808 RepID=A0A0C3E148_9AGAM|nr:hypothetical protein SCLCIDRAFT_1211259 [Scleroderma citrinum Foug A]